MSNNQLLYHWNTHGINENRIYSIDTFFKKYPDFENKLLNNKLEAMVKWHLNAINNQKSIKVILDNNIIDNLYKIFEGKTYAIKNNYNFYISNKSCYSMFNNFNEINNNDSHEKYDINYDITYFQEYFVEINKLINYDKRTQLCEFLNPNRNTLGIYISTNIIIDELYYQKCLSLLNFYEMNIIVFIKDSSYIHNIKFLNNINYNIITLDEDIILLLSYCDYIITNKSKFVLWGCLLSNAKKIFVPMDFEQKIDKNISYIDAKYIVDKILSIGYEYYILQNNILYKTAKPVDSNILYVTYDFIEHYEYDHKYDHNYNNIKTYIINLEHRTDRYENTLKECEKIGLTNYERFNAIKTDTIVINPKKAWKKNIEYLKGASGCKLSHLEVLKKFLISNNNEEYILILEDDVVFTDDALDKINSSLQSLDGIEWDILYLGINLKKRDDAIKVNDNLLSIITGLTTTAQIFKRLDVEKIIKIIEKSDVEIDNTYNNFLKNKYCVYPMCVYQKESYSDINGINMDYGQFHRKFEY